MIIMWGDRGFNYAWVEIILQYVNAVNQRIVHLDYMALYANYIPTKIK